MRHKLKVHLWLAALTMAATLLLTTNLVTSDLILSHSLHEDHHNHGHDHSGHDHHGHNHSDSVHHRSKRGVFQLAGVISCVAGCDPLSYKGYGCYCGYGGSGRAVDGIDRCCQIHDFCYSNSGCSQLKQYILPYDWECIGQGYAICNPIMPSGFSNDMCARTLCECDRRLARCLSRYRCPRMRMTCPSSPMFSFRSLIG